MFYRGNNSEFITTSHRYEEYVLGVKHMIMWFYILNLFRKAKDSAGNFREILRSCLLLYSF